jgi:hypothetical protein
VVTLASRSLQSKALAHEVKIIMAQLANEEKIEVVGAGKR